MNQQTSSHPPEPASQTAWQPDPERGFLPLSDPLPSLPRGFEAWEQAAVELPGLVAAGRVRRHLADLPQLDPAGVADGPELERGMMLLSYFGHAWVWGGPEPAKTIPAPVAVPWHAVAGRLGRPPVLSYASYALDNWRRFDAHGPVALGNIALRQHFLGGLDEAWFILVHVQIEAEAAPALAAIEPAQHAARNRDPEALLRQLHLIAGSLRTAAHTLGRMPEGCDPYIYYRRVRPYIHGWKGHPALPEGVIYEGVEAYGGRPQQFRGETGAQSGIVPAMDAALNIEHRDDPLRPYLMDMRNYMPPAHRAFLERIERGPSLRSGLTELDRPELRDAYNEAVEWLASFRNTHLEYARAYIARQAGRDRSGANPRQVGTGGTPFIDYLKKHHDETLEHRIG